MGIQQALSGLVQILINLILDSSIGFFVMPFLTMFAIVRFLRWALSQSRGTPDIDDIQGDAAQLRQRVNQAPERARGAFRRRF
jgi:hypothetical protein